MFSFEIIYISRPDCFWNNDSRISSANYYWRPRTVINVLSSFDIDRNNIKRLEKLRIVRKFKSLPKKFPSGEEFVVKFLFFHLVAKVYLEIDKNKIRVSVFQVL